MPIPGEQGEQSGIFNALILHLDKSRPPGIMGPDNLPRLGLESVDSFNCAHGEGFYLKPHFSHSQLATFYL